MKKIPIIIVLAFFFVSLNANASKLETVVNSENASVGVLNEMEVNKLAARVYEINNIDKSTLSSSEKFALKHELRTIKTKLTTFYDNGGIYIGGGTLLIIIILLILLL